MVLERFRALSSKKKQRCALATALVIVAAGCAMATPWDKNEDDRTACSNDPKCSQAMADCEIEISNDPNRDPNKPTIEGCVRAKHESSVKYPSVTVVAGDMRVGVVAGFVPDTENPIFPLFLPELNQGDTLSGQHPGASRHSGGANYVFADGHAKWFTSKAFMGAPDGKHPSFGLVQ